MGYKSKFKGAEIDARLEKMVNVTYAELKALRDEGKLIAGQMYRMTDYETTCTWANTKVAGHPFDLVLTALDNKTLDEKCSAIQSARDKDGYFANSNLAAWDVRYCLDNDKDRFDWAQNGGKTLTADLSQFGLSNSSAYLDGTFELDGTTYTKWNGGVLMGATVYFLTLNETPKYGDSISIYIKEQGAVVGEASFVSLRTDTAGKGVVYLLIDESENSVPYDFKNIMFSRPLTEGKYDAENGVDTFCYTFCRIDEDTYAIEDHSVKEPDYCYNNKLGDRCYDNVFISYDCYDNTFGNDCCNNTFQNCNSNVLGKGCAFINFSESAGNIIGANCSYITFIDTGYDNVLGDGCYDITFGEYCESNTFGDYCEAIILKSYDEYGGNCSHNTFGKMCRSINLVDYCQYLVFGDGCEEINLLNDETASNRNMVKYYKVDSIKRARIDVFRGRNYQTFVTTNSNGSVVEYTVDSIATNSNTPM